MNYKKIIPIVVIVALILGGIYYFIHHKNKNKSQIILFGNVEIRIVDLGFRVEGRIEKLFFEEGDVVKKGDLMATLVDTNYSAEYEDLIAQKKKAENESKNSTSKYKRNLKLCQDGTVSKQECDDLFYLKNQNSANLESIVAQIKLAKNNLDDTKLYAPDDGIITSRVQENGASTMAGQIVYTMSKTTPVWIRAYVNEKDLGNISYNMPARILTDSINPKTGEKREYKGRIGYISPVAEFTPKTVETTDLRTDLVYRIRVYVDELDEFLRQGMPTTIVIDLK